MSNNDTKLRLINDYSEDKLTRSFGDISEWVFESSIEKELQELGWISIDKETFKRPDYLDVFDWEALKQQVMTINNVDEEVSNKVLKEVRKTLLKINYQEANVIALHQLKYGVKVRDDIQHRDINYKLVDFIKPQNNKFTLIRQLEVLHEDGRKRYPDIVLFLNGIPVVVCEIKKPLAVEDTSDAFDQNQTLFKHSPHLFAYNILNFVSNNIITRYGNIDSPFKYYGGWKKWFLSSDSKHETPIQFLFDKKNFLRIIERYVFWSNGTKPIKYIAHPHQIKAVEKEIDRLKANQELSGRGGVIWHTQGSGKSVTMVFLTYVIQKEISNSTVILITDRNTLDVQLLDRFNEATTYLQTQPIHISSRNNLKQELNNRKGNGVFFSTIQKLEEGTGLLSKRSDIYIICDEAHRSQNSIDFGFKIKQSAQEITEKRGFASFLREAFPNAIYIGFTGTPLLGQLKIQTTDIFGSYIDKYLLKQAQEDGTVLKMYYENGAIDIRLPHYWKTKIDNMQQEFKESIQNEVDDIKSKKEFDLDKTLKGELILDNDVVIKAKVEHMMQHYFSRVEVLHGKAMIVASSRIAAYRYYETIVKMYPNMKEKIILVLSDDNKDTEGLISKTMVPRHKLDEVEKEFRKDNSKYKIAIVCAMWLTGYDCPDLDCLYLDKILKWHNLMQAIARVNRVYENAKEGKIKEYGLIVDYNNIWNPLLQALAQYGDEDANDEFSLDEVTLAKQKLLDFLAILNESFVLDILNVDKTDKIKIYQFVIKNAELITDLDKDKKSKFLTIVQNVNRYFKICFNQIDRNIKETISIVNIIKQLIIQREISCDENLELSKNKLIELINSAFKDPTTSVTVLSKTFKKDITTVTDILKETDDLSKISPKASIEFIKNWLRKEIDLILNKRPWVARQLSDKLEKIIKNMKEHANVDAILELLKELCKEYDSEINKPLEFNDPQLQSFFEILKSDNYFTKKYNDNSETLRNIAIDINNAIQKDGNINDQFLVNNKVKTSVVVALKKMLKNKYNYPPDELEISARRFVDSITEEIKIRPAKIWTQE